MSKLYLQHDYQVTGKDYVETEGGDTPAGGISYSTEEQDTGLTWIDGKKIYQRVYELGSTTVSQSTWVNTAIESAGIGQIVEAWGIYSSSGGMFLINANKAATYIQIIAGRASASTIDLMVMRYTKAE